VTGALIQGVAMSAFLLLGAAIPRDRAQGMVTRDTLINLVTGGALFVVRVTLVAWIAARSSVGVLDLAILDQGWMQAIVGLLLIDVIRYWLHRAHHQVSWLWTFHRVHHSSERLDATAGLRMHVVDFLQLSLLPLLLFSVVLDTTAWAPWVVPAVLSVGAVSDAFQHANLRWNPQHPMARAWGTLLNHPHFHAWHHTRDGHRCDGNYGNAFVIWDRMFGSEVTGSEPPEALGLEGHQALTNTVLGLQLLRNRRS